MFLLQATADANFVIREFVAEQQPEESRPLLH